MRLFGMGNVVRVGWNGIVVNTGITKVTVVANDKSQYGVKPHGSRASRIKKRYRIS